jgi:hypothetical protein
MTIVFLLHLLAHISAHWHESSGPFGWWVWTEWRNGSIGFGVIRGHLETYYATR